MPLQVAPLVQSAHFWNLLVPVVWSLTMGPYTMCLLLGTLGWLGSTYRPWWTPCQLLHPWAVGTSYSVSQTAVIVMGVKPAGIPVDLFHGLLKVDPVFVC
jgi:hypothetical protein